MNIPKRLFQNDVSYYHINNDSIEGIVSCGYLPKRDETKEHLFKYYGGLLVLSGRGKYIDEDGIVQQLYPGCFVQRRPNIKHTTIVEDGEPWLEFYVCIGPKLYNALGNIGIINTELSVLNIKLSPMVLYQCSQLLNDFKYAKEKEVNHLLVKVQSFLIFINELHQSINITSIEDRIIEMICDSLGNNFTDKLDLKAEAKKYGISYEKLRKLFKEKIGISPHQYRVTKKINEAQKLLHNPDISINEIADRLGYYDAFAFSNQFKKIIGIAPKAFREGR